MISVLIANYNGKALLQDCLTQLKRHESEWHEVIVVDNGSSDGSPEMVVREFPWCRLLRLPENVGFGTANNRAAEIAEGESLLLLNSDAWLGEGALARLRDALAQEPRAAIAAPQLYYPDGRLQFTWAPTIGVTGEAVQLVRNRFESAVWNYRLLPPLLRRMHGPGWYTAACLMIRRKAYIEAGGFDERIFMYFEDVDLCYRLTRAGWLLRSVPDASVFHIKGGSATENSEVAYREAQLYYYRKHRAAWENAVLRRRLLGKFRRIEKAELRRRLMALLEEPSALPRGAKPHGAKPRRAGTS